MFAKDELKVYIDNQLRKISSGFGGNKEYKTPVIERLGNMFWGM